MANTEPETYLSKHSIMTKKNLSPVVMSWLLCVKSAIKICPSTGVIYSTDINDAKEDVFNL